MTLLPEPRRMKISDLPKEFHLMIARDITQHSTGLAGAKESAGRPLLAFYGSGTFVRVDSRHFILTAAHVWESIERDPPLELRLPLTSFPSKIGFPFKALKGVYVGVKPPDWNEWGPDLAFIEIPAEYLGTIQARRTFYNLSRRRPEALQGIPDVKCGAWAVVGTPEKISRIEPRRLALEERVAFSGPTERRESGGYDYIDVTVDDVAVPNLPTTFGGVSGGGLWHIPLAFDEETGRIGYGRNLELEGVAFWEIRVSAGRRAIRCHGRHSIYRQGFAALGL